MIIGHKRILFASLGLALALLSSACQSNRAYRDALDEQAAENKRLLTEKDEEITRLRAGLENAERLAFERLDQLKTYDEALGRAHRAIAEREQEIGRLTAEATSSNP